MTEELNETVNREYKDRFFKKVFSTKEALLSLYNAVNGTDYDNPEDIEINTIEDFLFMSMKNDVSFFFTDTINLYEHQSTSNPNIHFRGLIYMAKLYQKLFLENRDFYGSRLVEIPTPQFVVFYNGTADEPDFSELRLSDAFRGKGRFDPALECKAIVLNINYKHNKDLMEKCEELRDYAILISKIRSNRDSGAPLGDAIDKAITECIEEGVLRDLLQAHRMEARDMLFTEYNEQAHIKNEKEISYEDGYDSGKEIMGKLFTELNRLNRLEDYSKAVNDPRYRDELIKEVLSSECV